MEANGTAITHAAPVAMATQAQFLRERLKEETEQRELLTAFVTAHMQDGVDYGKIPGTDKKNLLKPGAEKIVDLYGCTARIKITDAVRDHEHGFYFYEITCRIVNRRTGEVIAEGVGSCNTREGRYRWRNGSRKCPDCGKEVRKSKPPKRGFYCWQKLGGCGAEFDEHDKEITDQVVGRVENDDPHGQANTVLKMAKKRAQVDAALTLCRGSGLFTQDLEDMPEMAGAEAVLADIAKEKAAEKAEHAGTAPVPVATAPAAAKPEEAKPASSPPAAAPVADKLAGARTAAALRARTARLWKAFQDAKYTAEFWKAWSIDILKREKPSAEWTADDLEKLEAAWTLEQAKKRTEDIQF